MAMDAGSTRANSSQEKKGRPRANRSLGFSSQKVKTSQFQSWATAIAASQMPPNTRFKRPGAAKAASRAAASLAPKAKATAPAHTRPAEPTRPPPPKASRTPDPKPPPAARSAPAPAASQSQRESQGHQCQSQSRSQNHQSPKKWQMKVVRMAIAYCYGARYRTKPQH